MQYCGPRALPHSTFLTWHQDDQDKALAWLVRDLRKCPSCGTNPSDWKAPDGKAAIPPPWEWELTICYGCRERDRQEDAFEGDKAGIYSALVPVRMNDYDEDLWNVDASDD